MLEMLAVLDGLYRLLSNQLTIFLILLCSNGYMFYLLLNIEGKKLFILLK